MISVFSTSMNTIFRSPLCSIGNLRNFTTNSNILYFKMTETLLGEPLKKKRRIDPAVVRAREERKRKKLEKRIRFLEKHAGHLKPIFEIDLLADMMKEKKAPTPKLSAEEIQRRTMLRKEWTAYKSNEWSKDLQVIESMMLSQKNALEELKAVSEELYQKAIELDETFLPYHTVGPVHTPPINNYDSPDGEYVETTIKYMGE